MTTKVQARRMFEALTVKYREDLIFDISRDIFIRYDPEENDNAPCFKAREDI